VATTLNEIALAAKVSVELDEALIPVSETVRAACEILGLDPLYVANEGVVLVILPEAYASEAVAIMRRFPEGRDAALIGNVVSSGSPLVTVKTLYGGHRVVTMLNGEQLPRIC
jgi:hydrogenase expression/formation protein HypE